MELDELLYAYKQLHFKKRVMITVIVGLLPSAYMWLEEGEELAKELQTVQVQERALRSKFSESQAMASELPKLREKLAFTEEQLEKARRYLPDTIEMDEILASSAKIGKALEINFVKFQPLVEFRPNEDVQYLEYPVKINFRSDYNKIATFFDRIVHQEKIVHVRNIKMSKPMQAFRGNSDNSKSNDVSGLIDTEAEIVVFRGVDRGL